MTASQSHDVLARRRAQRGRAVLLALMTVAASGFVAGFALGALLI